jgi:hypothetical protein
MMNLKQANLAQLWQIMMHEPCEFSLKVEALKEFKRRKKPSYTITNYREKRHGH